MPLPFAPNELMLLLAGVLIATGVLSPFEFIPLALIAMTAGSFLGYTWANRVGSPALERLADRLHATAVYTRAVHRLQHAGMVSIIVARLIPAVRIQATLAAGAAGVDRGLFFSANAIAIAIWLGVLTGVGWAVGLPAEHYVGFVISLLVSGGVLIGLGAASYWIARRAPMIADASAIAMRGTPTVVRTVLAGLLDLSIIAVLVAGIGRIARYIAVARSINLGLPFVPDGVYDLLVTIAVAALGYLALSRFSIRSTVGERVFTAHYWRMGRRDTVRR